MVYKVIIKDNTNTPYNYVSKLKNFKNGTEYIFKPGVNIIVGKNGCGKTTLMNLIRSYLLVDYTECGKGSYNHTITDLYKGVIGDNLLDGVDVYADYDKNTFRLSHAGEKENSQNIDTFHDFKTVFKQHQASTGEGVSIALESLFDYMFGKDVKLKFDYSQLKDSFPKYAEYISKHKDTSIDEYTILMDEPDRNLDITRINDIKNILSFHKEQTQIIAVVHNPLLIYSLSNNPEVNIIEMTKGYVNKVKKTIDILLK